MLEKRFKNRTGQAAVELAILGSLILIGFSVILMYGQRFEAQQQIKMEAFRRAMQKAYKRNSSVSYTLKKDTRFFNLFSGFGQGQASTLGASASVMWQKGASGTQGTDDQQSFGYYQINDDLVGEETIDGDKVAKRYPKYIVDYTGNPRIVKVPASPWKENRRKIELYNSTVTKDETEAGIRNTRIANLQETVDTTMNIRLDISLDEEPWDDEPYGDNGLPEYKYQGQSYELEGEGTYTVTSMPTVSQGTYYNEDSGRIEYSGQAAQEGTTVYREKTWWTKH